MQQKLIIKFKVKLINKPDKKAQVQEIKMEAQEVSFQLTI